MKLQILQTFVALQDSAFSIPCSVMTLATQNTVLMKEIQVMCENTN